jgi:hypothetical protein
MSLKIESPRLPQVSRPEVRIPMAPSIARGEPAPSAMPRPLSDGFERLAPHVGHKAPGGSRFEGVGSALRPLPQRLEQSARLADNVVKFFAQDSKLQELGRSDPRKARQILQASFQASGLSSRDAKILTNRYAAPQLAGALGKGSLEGSTSTPRFADTSSTGGSGLSEAEEDALASIRTTGTTRPTDGLADMTKDTVNQLINGADPAQFKTWGDVEKFTNQVLHSVQLQDGDSKEALKAYVALKLGERLVSEGIDLGKNTGGKIGPGKDAFEGLQQGGFVPSEPLEDLPRELEPHRETLSKLTDTLLRDAKLDNDAKLRKALWSELKKLPLQDDAVRHDARQYLLEELSLRQDRYTA